ncbi:MAG: trypsin-like serine protease [Pseudomonadota bacterium]
MPGIIGSDDRVLLDPTAWPWTALGRVNREGGGFCTGTLVAPDLVLTAGHCLYDRRSGRRLSPDRLHFVAGYRRGEFLAHSVARDIRQPVAYDVEAPADAGKLANDWALLVLERPMDIEPIGVRPVKGPADAALLLAGYAQDRPHLLSLHEGCAVQTRAAGLPLFTHTCDAARGGSGAPLLVKTPDGFALVGLHVGVINAASRPEGLAVHAPAFLPALEARP